MPPSAAALAKSESDIIFVEDIVFVVDFALSEAGVEPAAKAAMPAQAKARDIANARCLNCTVMTGSSCSTDQANEGPGWETRRVGTIHVCLHRQDTSLAFYIVMRYKMSSAPGMGRRTAASIYVAALNIV